MLIDIAPAPHTPWVFGAGVSYYKHIYVLSYEAGLAVVRF